MKQNDSHQRQGSASTRRGASKAEVFELTADAEVAEEASLEKANSFSAETFRKIKKMPMFWVSSILVLLFIILAAFPQLFAWGDPGPADCDMAKYILPPSAEHPFGTDQLGCGMYTQVMYGARPGITIAFTVASITFVMSAVLGALAAYFGGWVDGVIARIADVVFGMPFMVAAIVILNQFKERSVWSIALVLIIFGWAGGMRYMRGLALKVKNLEYVTASRALGAGHWRLIKNHVIPNSITPLIVLSTMGVAGLIGAEAGLTFLGVGLKAPTISWGIQLAQARNLVDQAPHLLWFPLIFLALNVIVFVVLGECLRRALDPKGK